MPTIDHECEFPVSPHAVYDAITTPVGLRGWWAQDSDVATAIGETTTMRFDKGGRSVQMRFRIDEMVPDRRAVWTCTENGNPVWIGTTLTFALAATTTGTKLSFSHSGFREDESPPFKMTVDGWNHFMGSLAAYVEHGRGQPW